MSCVCVCVGVGVGVGVPQVFLEIPLQEQMENSGSVEQQQARLPCTAMADTDSLPPRVGKS